MPETPETARIIGAASDVFPVEPQGNDAAFVSTLSRFDSVTLTPHIGDSTLEAQLNIGAEVVARLIRHRSNGSTTSAVNFPQSGATSSEPCPRYSRASTATQATSGFN